MPLQLCFFIISYYPILVLQNMAQMKPYILVAVFVVLIAIQGTLVQCDDNNSGDNEDHDDMEPLGNGQEQAKCKAKGHCKNKILVCPAQCPEKKPTKNRKHKGCFVDCTSKCEVTCKCKCPFHIVFLLKFEFFFHFK